MQLTHTLYKIIIVFSLLLVSLSMVTYAEDLNETDIPGESVQIADDKTGLLYNGTINPTDSISVTADSGKSYTIPGNTPVGVLESLSGSGMISGYRLGDELMEKKDILMIDEIGGLKFGNESGWFVKVNGERLEDVVLSDVMGLNKYQLKEGDVVIYALGNPESMVSESVAYLTVTIGSIQKTPENEKDNQGEGTSEEEPDDGSYNVTNSSEDSETSDNLSDTQDNAETITSGESETDESDSKSSKSSSGGQDIIYDGSLSLPSGTVTITTTGGDYDISAASPLGILYTLLKDDRISDLSVSDKSMQKGGILFLEGINDYHFSGDKTWFVTVNDSVLKDYMDPEKEGLNNYKVSSGDVVMYYFGEPSKPFDEAVSSIKITIE